jgi:HK97 family phage major capsid protein
MKLDSRIILGALLCAVFVLAAVFGVDIAAQAAAHPDFALGVSALALLGETKPVSLDDVKGMLQDMQRDHQSAIKEAKDVTEKALAEVKEFKTITGQTNDQLKEVGEKTIKLQGDLVELQQKFDKVNLQIAAAGPGEAKSIGQIVIESEQFKLASKASGKPEMAAVEVGSFKTAIVNATQNTSQPLVQAHHAGFVAPGLQPLSVRDLLPTYRCESNVVTFTKEATFTNNAAIQYSSPNYENVSKAESAMTFELAEAPVRTIAHFIPASRQVLSDAKMLQSYIEGRLMYGVKLEEEDEILNGDNSAGHLNGLMAQATAYAGSGAVSTDTELDTLLRALTQCFTGSYFMADGILMTPTKWMQIQLLKDTTGRYLFGNPYDMVAPRVWGTRVVQTLSLSGTKFLVGAFRAGAAIWDREDASIRIAEQHSDFFVKNMVAILAEERLALTVFRPTAFIRGNFLA